MDDCEVLVVGGGPAGSSCARALVQSGVDVCVIDKAPFPRDKVCGGWITPQTVASLELDLDAYGRGRTLQEITSFAVGLVGGRVAKVDYGRAVSHAIRRCEFDDYLLRRAGARLRLAEPVEAIERVAGGWCVNGALRTRLLVGAGGHGCPVARALGRGAATSGEPIAGQEVEFAMTAPEAARCSVPATEPLLLFCRDLRGYGWCVRKGDFVNVGLGRIGGQGLGRQVRAFWEELERAGAVAGPPRTPFKGHAYLSYPASRRAEVADGALLIGDAAGLADPQSGEGIRTAIESGLLAAAAIVAARGEFGAAHLESYAAGLATRFGPRVAAAAEPGTGSLATLRNAIGRWLLTQPLFVRSVVLDRWFLHSARPALAAPAPGPRLATAYSA